MSAGSWIAFHVEIFNMSCRVFVAMLFVPALLTACAPRPVQINLEKVEALIRPSGNCVRIVETDLFPLLTVTAVAPSTIHDQVLRVYIEGDGLAWRTRRQLSAHPTPVNPLALRLMLADPSPDKLYIARPCQFVQSSSCDPSFWSTHRYAAVVIESVSSALSRIKLEKGYTRLELVGYSGGGAVALLLAAQRNDVLSVRTVSGNLDPAAFCRLHHVSPLNGSLNPVDYVKQLQGIPQLHFIGTEDSIVPLAVFSSYRGYFPQLSPIRSRLVSDIDHRNGWVERWPQLLLQIP